jgi:hypothetical protein
MDKGTYKESQQVLRRIQDHLYKAHLNLGAMAESVGMVDVLHHADHTLSSLNYVVPRRNTAWVSGPAVQQGLQQLQQLGRVPRVHYIEGLYPPLLAKTLGELGLKVDHEVPLMAYLPNGFADCTPPPVMVDDLPDGIRLEATSEQHTSQLWWYVRNNTFFHVTGLWTEPLYINQDAASLKASTQRDVVMYRNGFPVGVVRVSVQEETAHIVALALMKEARSPDLISILLAGALKAALDQGCTLIYTQGDTDLDRKAARALGFLDFGSIVCYTSNATEAEEEYNDHILGQPVFALR